MSALVVVLVLIPVALRRIGPVDQVLVLFRVSVIRAALVGDHGRFAPGRTVL